MYSKCTTSEEVRCDTQQLQGVTRGRHGLIARKPLEMHVFSPPALSRGSGNESRPSSRKSHTAQKFYFNFQTLPMPTFAGNVTAKFEMESLIIEELEGPNDIYGLEYSYFGHSPVIATSLITQEFITHPAIDLLIIPDTIV